jgi:hypothetical protein
MSKTFLGALAHAHEPVDGTSNSVWAQLAGQILAVGGAVGLVTGLLSQCVALSQSSLAICSLCVLTVVLILIYRSAVSRYISSSWLLISLALVIGSVLALHPYFEQRMEGPFGPADAAVVAVYPVANDYLGKMGGLINAANSDITFAGASFYISLPQQRENLLAAIERGVRVRVLFLDPYSPNIQQIAEAFQDTTDVLVNEGINTAIFLDQLRNQARGAGYPGRLEVKLLHNPIGARFYIFDRANQNSLTYFIPYVNGKNSPTTPGLLLKNVPTGIASKYYGAIENAWDEGVDFDVWLQSHHPTTTRPVPAINASLSNTK